MLLPEGIRRDNTKMYEEVEIPPNEPMPIGFEEKPIYISELDEVNSHGPSFFVCVCLFTLFGSNSFISKENLVAGGEDPLVIFSGCSNLPF